MPNNADKNKAKTDWSFMDSSLNNESESPTDSQPVSGQIEQREIITTGESDISSTKAFGLPDPDTANGILMQYKQKKITRKATLQALQEQYNSGLDTLKYQLSKASHVQKVRADVFAEEYLKQLDSRQLEVLTQLGLRNKDTRERALLDLTEMTVSKLREVQEKDWPDELKSDAINELMALRKRTVSGIMKELGSDYSSE